MIPTPPFPPDRGPRQSPLPTPMPTPLPPSSLAWQAGPEQIPVPAVGAMPGAASIAGQNSVFGISQQQTAPQIPAAPPTSVSDTGIIAESEKIVVPSDRRKRLNQVIAVGLLLALLVALFFTWNTATPAASPTSNNPSQQNFTSTTNAPSNTSADNSTGSGNTITVYIVGAVKHPGVYNLPPDARVYQVLQAAGGPQSDANLVALNLAAKLTDGEEIYVTHIGEVPPTYYGGVPQLGTGSNNTGNSQLVNINTASADEMRQTLHISSTTANAIINYRTQNGPFTSVDQLQQVVSQSIYDKIKDEVTV
ncbi:MAG TPA: ComEA family DNA-binding protein [Ktedonobacteraceae bacterium]|nr:ComEA family DNA-binding protein [Ktedonobacteraceae bacterium]